MRPVIHHFHSNPPRHGMKYYVVFAACVLAVGAVYAAVSLLVRAL